MAIREGRWRCPYCATPNRGRDLACSACGTTRDVSVTFFLEQDAHEVVEQTLIAQELPKDRWSQLREGESRTAVIRGGRRVVALR